MKFFLLILLCNLLFQACTGRENLETRAAGPSIVVFIPGVMAGSAIYEMLAEGAQRAVNEFAALNPDAAPTLTIIEGGFNQAAWETQITTLAASGDFDLIVSSNPSLPLIVSTVSARFPQQKFLLLDAELEGNPNVYTLRYNQREQAFMAGYLAALATLENGGGAKRLGIVAGQEYPVMNTIIMPGFLEGARAVDPDFEIDFRVVGNWFDAARAADLTASMMRAGVHVSMPIAGGAGHGAVQAAAQGGAKIIWFDTNGYAIRPGTVIGSAILRQDKAAYEKTMLYLKGQLPFGQAEIVGAADGFVDFVEDDPLYIAALSRSIRERQAALTTSIRRGGFIVPELGF
jgi:simple sugar transport system substrate-binding protein